LAFGAAVIPVGGVWFVEESAAGPDVGGEEIGAVCCTVYEDDRPGL
jgi:hypothetical protein